MFFCCERFKEATPHGVQQIQEYNSLACNRATFLLPKQRASLNLGSPLLAVHFCASIKM
jgi:hypothetical protein